MPENFSVGIDLGTSNSALAVLSGEEAEATVLDIPQLVASGSVGNAKLLPSALYIPHAGELSSDAVKLPWEAQGDATAVTGVWARERGAQAPDRIVTSAKSWLCHPLVDRRARILPWKSEIAEPKVSPVEASRRYLEHHRHAFEQSREAKITEAKVVLTVPASFDEVARSLTYEAAEAAGLGRVVLLEEPQAAFYSWLAQAGERWRDTVKPGDIVLVVDVGGGTTDFSLIAVTDRDGNLELERIAVGEHLLLGGDNMDLALAYRAKAQFEAEGKAIDAWQMQALIHAARLAKERLLSQPELDEVPIALASRGASLFKKAATTKLSRETVMAVAVEGFVPLTGPDVMPAQRRMVGLQEYGLPFVHDPAISKHLARFLTRSLQSVKSDSHLTELVARSQDIEAAGFVRPTAVLFNGGVFNAVAIRERLMQLLSGWAGGQPVKELTGSHLDLAVAKGAASYARTLHEGRGIRIKAGTARAYYLGIAPTEPAVPGYEPPTKGLCIVPQGVEEGSELRLEGQTFGLVTGEPVEFRFFNSAARAGDTVGTVIENAERELEESAPLQVTLPPVEGENGEVVPVQLDAVVTEVGTLELWMKHTQSDRKWNLEFNVRPPQE